MNKNFIFFILLSLFFTYNSFAQDQINLEQLNKLAFTHDLNLPDWGPYTKRYIGVSHIPDIKKGIRFDLSVFPSFYRRKVEVPNVLYETNYHPWDASPNLEYFSFRHELEWKDQVYADISYSKIDKDSRLIRIECVNNSEQNQNLALNFMAFLNFPPIKEYSPYTPIYPAEVTLPNKAQWFDALNYEDLIFSKTRPTDNLVYDGKMRGEIRDHGFVNGSGIGLDFGKDKGDIVKYKIDVQDNFENAILLIRYKLDENQNVSFNLSGIKSEKINFSGGNEFQLKIIKLGEISKGQHELELNSLGGNGIQFDGFIIAESDDLDKIKFTNKEWNPVPQIISGPTKNSIILKYDDVDLYYGLLWQFDISQIREWYGRDLSDYFKQMVNEHVQTKFYGEGKGHYTNVFLRPIVMRPKSGKTIYGVVCYGTKDEVMQNLTDLNQSENEYDKYYLNAKSNVVKMDGNSEGEKYKFSIERMNATLNCNVVYPVYTQKEYIRHSAPGRWWDCLYTWDSGFIGMGYLQTNTQKAIENLNAYVQEPGAQSAFIHHGTPVPTQHYLFMELWNKTQSKDMLEYFYPRLKQYHEFMAGRLGSSTTKVLKSNLLKTWDYFYNSGGWDDLSPQKYTHDNKLEATVSPVITSSQVIRTAKILIMTAKELGKVDDIKEFENDIQTFTKALQKYSWDEKSGYYSYVVHDENGNPLKILTTENNINYDMTFDGAYPLVAGICNNEQKKSLISKIESKQHLWSNAGLTAVDQSAPYYNIDGYWNGTVWMSHQWFFWKTMLDLGESEFAYEIAETGLNVWKNEVEASYNCMEHFLVETGRGAGWHEFGALSSPVVIWYSAYFMPGNITTGFDIWTNKKEFNDNNSSFNAELTNFSENNKSSVVVCMNPNFEYVVKWNGEKLSYKQIADGTLSINLDMHQNEKGNLKVSVSQNKK